MLEADVLCFNQIGPPFSYTSAQEGGLGGSEYEITQIAHELAARGHRCIVANGVHERVEDHGVLYIPHKEAGEVLCKALYLERWSHNSVLPRANTESVVVRATDVNCPPYDVHLPILTTGRATLVCVSNYQAKAFLFAKKKAVIPPMYGPVPKVDKVPGRFIYASAPSKGLGQTVQMWKELKIRYADELKAAHLVVVTPGYSFLDPPDLEAAKEFDVTYVGSPAPQEYRNIVATGHLLYVNCFTETYGGCGAMTEMGGGRTHILCLHGKGGLPEALCNTRLLTADRDRFEADFMAAWRDPNNPEWYAADMKDRSPAALVSYWEKALGLKS